MLNTQYILHVVGSRKAGKHSTNNFPHAVCILQCTLDVLRGGFDVDIPLFGRKRDDLPYSVAEYQVCSEHKSPVFRVAI